MRIAIRLSVLFLLVALNMPSEKINAMHSALQGQQRDNQQEDTQKEKNSSTTSDQEYKEPECAICGANNQDEPILTLACRCKAKDDKPRQFHLLCIGNWIKTKGQDATCPVCSARFKFSNLMLADGEPLINGMVIDNPKRKQQARVLFNFKKHFSYANLTDLTKAFADKEDIINEEDENISEEDLAEMIARGKQQQKELKEQVRRTARQSDNIPENMRRVRDEFHRHRPGRNTFCHSRNMRNLAKLLPQEFAAGILNGFIARTLFESDILTDMPSQTLGGTGILLLFVGSNGLLHLINPRRTNNVGKIVACWAAGLAIGGYLIPNQLQKYVKKVK